MPCSEKELVPKLSPIFRHGKYCVRKHADGENLGHKAFGHAGQSPGMGNSTFQGVGLLQKRYTSILAVVAICLVVAVVGYGASSDEKPVPARFVLDNTGGRVISSHVEHADDYGYSCDDCHHGGSENENVSPVPCGSCHPKEFDNDFKIKHQTAFPDKEYCLRCHDDAPKAGTQLAEDDRPDSEMIPARGDAFHDQCMGCHQSEEAGPYGEQSCYECHARK